MKQVQGTSNVQIWSLYSKIGNYPAGYNHCAYFYFLPRPILVSLTHFNFRTISVFEFRWYQRTLLTNSEKRWKVLINQLHLKFFAKKRNLNSDWIFYRRVSVETFENLNAKVCFELAFFLNSTQNHFGNTQTTCIIFAYFCCGY